MYAARNKDNTLLVFSIEPEKDEKSGQFICQTGNSVLDFGKSELLKELTYENSPQKIDIKLSVKAKKSKPKKVCKLCRFYYENPRCMTGVPCNDWQFDKYRKEQLIINKFILMMVLILSAVIGIKVDSAVGGYSDSIAIVALKQN